MFAIDHQGFACGGKADAVERCRDLFATFAREVFNVGPCGAGAHLPSGDIVSPTRRSLLTVIPSGPNSALSRINRPVGGGRGTEHGRGNQRNGECAGHHPGELSVSTGNIGN
jgi:hypothetical protein